MRDARTLGVILRGASHRSHCKIPTPSCRAPIRKVKVGRRAAAAFTIGDQPFAETMIASMHHLKCISRNIDVEATGVPVSCPLFAKGVTGVVGSCPLDPASSLSSSFFNAFALHISSSIVASVVSELILSSYQRLPSAMQFPSETMTELVMPFGKYLMHSTR